MTKDDVLLLRRDAGGGTRQTVVRHAGGLASADGVAFEKESVQVEEAEGLRAVEWVGTRFCDCGTILDGKEASITGRCSHPGCTALTCSKCVRRCSAHGDSMTYCPRHARTYADGRSYCSRHRWVRFWRAFWRI